MRHRGWQKQVLSGVGLERRVCGHVHTEGVQRGVARPNLEALPHVGATEQLPPAAMGQRSLISTQRSLIHDAARLRRRAMHSDPGALGAWFGISVEGFGSGC